ncbi:putative Ser/Thr protein kinase KinX [Hungatella hathewayi CAG:224]|nr:putative Ser/Thr protein kinase KinX [Hungatella hathewayi CAG:224]
MVRLSRAAPNTSLSAYWVQPPVSYSVAPAGTKMVRLGIPSKADFPKVGALGMGRVSEVSPMQFSNAKFPIEVNSLGSDVSARFLQSENAESPIDFKSLGSLSSARLPQRENAAFPIEVTFSGSSSSARLPQSENAAFPIEVTFSGSSSSARFSQY